MRCAKAREYLSHQMDEQLSPDQIGDLDRHLDGCSDCREYQADLALGSRLISATEPELPANFEWKLQLKLNQTMQQAAGEAAFPWQEENPDRWRWLRNFGAAAAVGMAVVLALAVFFEPVGRSLEEGAVGSSLVAEADPAASGTDRLPLGIGDSSRSGLSGLQRNVSTGRPVSVGGGTLYRGWTGRSLEDGRTIQLLRRQNLQLQQRLQQVELQMRGMRAKLDTAKVPALDTGDTELDR